MLGSRIRSFKVIKCNSKDFHMNKSIVKNVNKKQYEYFKYFFTEEKKAITIM